MENNLAFSCIVNTGYEANQSKLFLEKLNLLVDTNIGILDAGEVFVEDVFTAPEDLLLPLEVSNTTLES